MAATIHDLDVEGGERSDDDESEDYVPSDHPSDDEDEDEDGLGGGEQLEGLTGTRKRKADALWEELRETEDQQMQAVRDAVAAVAVTQGSAATTGTKKMKKKKATQTKADMRRRKKLAKRRKQANKVLAKVFGKSEAQNIVAGSTLGSGTIAGPASSSSSSSSAAAPSAGMTGKYARAGKRVKVSESVKYAGKEIMVTRTVTGAEADVLDRRAAEKERNATNLDHVLAQLDAPKSISTVTKSSVDWENYKEDQGLRDELTQASKDGYIAKQEFLERCDVREYENEKQTRSSKRGAAAAAAAAIGGGA